MVKFKPALKRILDSVEMTGTEYVRLADALGRVLAADVYSNSDIPGFDNSGMDGYAVRSSDTAGASKHNPKTLEVIEEIKAGGLPKKTLRRDQAARIMTGAPIPKGADSVVMVEHTKSIQDGPKELVKVYQEARRSGNIRKKAEDIKKGELAVSCGTPLNCAHIGILASLGRTRVLVARRPKIAILATGDELIDVDEKKGPGKVRSSNSYTLHSQIVMAGCIPKNLGIAKDDSRHLEDKIRPGLDCDILLTSGGVSVGKYDLVKDVLVKMGMKLKFWKVAIKPGKPLVFGKIKKTLVFGLPGNPASGMVGFEMFVRPVILKMTGRKKDDRREVEAVLEEDVEKKKGLRYFLRARTRWEKGAYLTRISGPQGSGLLKPMAQANSLLILEEGSGLVKKGTRVNVRFLDQA